jgi:protein-disulfide isomerase
MNNKKIIFTVSSLLMIVLFVAGGSFYKSYQSKQVGLLALENKELFIRDHSPQFGNKDAKVHLIEFVDPECESCRAFYPVVKNLLKKYDGKVQLILRFVPFHTNSKKAIRVLLAAKEQGKFWETLNVLFQYQPIWAAHHNPQPHRMFDYLPEANVDVAKIKERMNDSNYEKIIDTDFSDSKTLKVRGTPTFFVNGNALEGFGLEYLVKAIDAEIAKLY